MRITILAVLFLFISCSEKPQTEVEQWEAQAENITIIRDDFGVPHIYGKTDADAVRQGDHADMRADTYRRI